MIAILAREIRASVQSRWFVAVTAVFGALGLGGSYLSFSGASSLGFAGFSRTVAGLLNLSLLFVPLMGMLLGTLTLAGEREDGTLGYLLAQPVGRGSVYWLKFAGQWASLTFAIALGLGVAGLVVGWKAGSGGLSGYATLAGASILLGAASLGLGILVGVACPTRLRALAMALVLWIAFGFALDLASVGLVVSGTIGPRGLFFVSMLNPVQIAKILCMLSMSAKLEMLGPAGIYGVKTLGEAGAMANLVAMLLAWAAVPAAIGVVIFRRVNVRGSGVWWRLWS